MENIYLVADDFLKEKTSTKIHTKIRVVHVLTAENNRKGMLIDRVGYIKHLYVIRMQKKILR